MPWTMDGSKDHESVDARRRAANNAGWRNLATGADGQQGIAASPSRNATDQYHPRKTTDVIFHKDPTMAHPRHLAMTSDAFAGTYAEIAGAIDPSTASSNGGAIYGRGSSDVSRNAPTWGEVMPATPAPCTQTPCPAPFSLTLAATRCRCECRRCIAK